MKEWGCESHWELTADSSWEVQSLSKAGLEVSRGQTWERGKGCAGSGMGSGPQKVILEEGGK